MIGRHENKTVYLTVSAAQFDRFHSQKSNALLVIESFGRPIGGVGSEDDDDDSDE